MTTARTIITTACGAHLNRLAAGETLDADTAARCLDQLNDLADSLNGTKHFLFRDILSAGTVTSSTGTLGSTWSSLTPGSPILGATYADSAGDNEITPLTMQQYHAIGDKTTAGDPECFAFDGYATLYFYPVPTSVVVTLRTRAIIATFADLDTDYGMPSGYRSALSLLLAERMGPSLVGGVPGLVRDKAAAALRAIGARNFSPAILGGASTRPTILTGP